MPRARSRRFARRRFTGRKRRFTRRRRSVRRTGRASARSATTGDRGAVLNRRPREKPVRISVTQLSTRVDSVSSGSSAGWFFAFDPAYVVVPSGAAIFNGSAIPQWAALSAEYTYYKVRSIRIRCRPFSSDIVLGTNQIRSFMRYQYDVAAPIPTSTVMSDHVNVKMHWFTPEAPEMTYKMYPRVPAPTGAASISGYYGITPQKMKWCETSDPVPIYGMEIFHQNSDAARAFNMTYDLEWDLLFWKKR